MMFDTVAAAHLFPEYFWIGNSYGYFLSFGWAENGFKNGISNLISGLPTTDNRGQRRGYKLSAQQGATRFDVNILNIGESIGSSRYKNDGSGNYPDGQPFKHPWSGKTQPKPLNEYSWLKAPRYKHNTSGIYMPMEVGPLARLVVDGNYYAGVLNALGYTVTPVWNQSGPDCAGGADLIGGALKPVYALIPGVTGGPNLSGVQYKGDSTLDRIAARTVETLIYGMLCQQYLNDLQGTIGGDGYATTGVTDPVVPVTTTVKKGYGMTEASRGALSHWIKMKNGKIQNYQAVVPTTWNACPRDVNGTPGPAERSMESGGGAWVANPAQAIELPRITHSYDFCIACAVHLITPKGEKIRVDVPALP
jgi:Ni,Fe-hydrogenase I large subunit